ncbi:MAG: YARHG domain-containing protein [Bacteroidetes bacterium]|nr:YARHG domain-containing protein [Bacteroidota bacterium]
MKNILFLIVTIIFISCGKKDNPNLQSNEQKIDSSSTTEVKSKSPTDSVNKILGYYVGEFIAEEFNEESPYTYSNKITISIDLISNDSLYGHSVVAGNNRPFRGSVEYKNNSYAAKVSEPGDDKYDGQFSFTVYPDSLRINGKWNSYDKKIMVTKRTYSLGKRDFVYNKENKIPDEKNWNTLYEQNPRFPDKIEQISGEISKINASNTLLTKSDVENLYKGDLEIIRNSIYARHGYSFQNRKMRYFFDNEIDWYMPVTTDVRNELTETEKKNIDLLKRYEDHAESYYDSYGR